MFHLSDTRFNGHTLVYYIEHSSAHATGLNKNNNPPHYLIVSIYQFGILW